MVGSILVALASKANHDCLMARIEEDSDESEFGGTRWSDNSKSGWLAGSTT
jgi:hypothetical protein